MRFIFYLALIAAIGFLFITGVVVGDRYMQDSQELGRANSFSSNSITMQATTTTSVLPIQVASTTATRRYGMVINDSDTAIYLHLGYFSDARAASTTVSLNNGIKLAAAGTTGDRWEIDQNNLYLGQIWATSTADSKRILWVESSNY